MPEQRSTQKPPVTRLRGADVKRAVFQGTDAFNVHYDYVDASVSSSKPRKVPAWSATDVRIRAYYAEMGRPLDELASTIAGMPGCRTVEVVRGHPTLRPQVVALFR